MPTNCLAFSTVSTEPMPTPHFSCHHPRGDALFATTETCALRKGVASKGRKSLYGMEGMHSLVGVRYPECCDCPGPVDLETGEVVQVEAIKPSRVPLAKLRAPFAVSVGQEPNEARAEKAAAKGCLVEGCGRKHSGLGFCEYHRKAFHRERARVARLAWQAEMDASGGKDDEEGREMPLMTTKEAAEKLQEYYYPGQDCEARLVVTCAANGRVSQECQIWPPMTWPIFGTDFEECFDVLVQRLAGKAEGKEEK